MKHAIVFASVLGLSLAAHARNQYVQEVPNGATFRCLTCHERSGGGEGWNLFGKELLERGGANPDANPTNQNLGYDFALGTPSDFWLDICNLDSDDDGSTNAEELGDLDCDAVADEGLIASNPGDPASTPDTPGDGGEGEGEPDVGGCAAAPLDSPASLLGAVAMLALLRRRKSG